MILPPFSFKRQDKADMADAATGSSVLRTSHTDWEAGKILRTYWRLTDFENTFRQLKSELGLRSIWHGIDARISAHLLITVPANHAVHLIRTKLRNAGINLRWDWDPGLRGTVRGHKGRFFFS